MNKNFTSLSQRMCLALAFSFFSVLWCNMSYSQQWTILGNENQVSAVSSNYTSIAVLDTVPYVVYREGTEAKVKRKNTSTGAWEQVGDIIGSNVIYPRIMVDKTNNLYVTYVDASNGNRLAVKMYNDTMQLWQPLHNNSNNLYVSTGTVNGASGVTQYSSTPRSSLAFDSDNRPYIAYAEGSMLTPFVKRFIDSAWQTVGTGAVNTADTAVAVTLVLDEADVPWLAFVKLAASNSTTGSMALYRFGGGTWTRMSSNFNGIRHTSMALTPNNNLAIAYFNTGNSNRATVVIYDKTAGTFGTTTSLSSRDAPSLSLIRDISGNLYCSFIDAISSAFRNAARVFKLELQSTTWRELKDPAMTGIDEPVGNLTIAVGSDTARPHIVYTRSNSAGVTTPVVRAYTPPSPPATLTTTAATNITSTSAVAGGNITADGGTAITERGIVYGTSLNPTTANTKIVDGSTGLGSFSATINGLATATLYYVRAYAISGGGTVTYGSNIRFNTLPLAGSVVTAPKQMELLNRGVVAVRTSSTRVFVSWRMLGTEPSSVSYNLYRNGVKVNNSPITNSTNFEDNATINGTYTVTAIINGVEGTASAPSPTWSNNQLTIPMQIPPGGTTPDGVAYTYTANDCSVGDVDADGEYEVFVKWDPTKLNHNSGGYSGDQIIDCYKMNGTRLWRINLGKNINAGPHFTQFMVYDLDGDGKAEMACKTADGTIDGTGAVLGNPTVDYRNSAGWVHQGPEYLTVFNGLTGAAMSTATYQPARGNISDWGDNYGNRADRFVSAVAYLDGVRPSLVIGRGYYNKLARAAYDFRNGQLTLRWKFDSSDPGNGAYAGQGNHQMTIGDVDGDGKDEVINGSSAIDDDGKRLWTYRMGHGDALHMSDMDPDRPGQEIWINLESPSEYDGMGLRMYDAKTGQTIWGVPTTGDVGRSMAADIDPAHKGYEVWGSAGNLYNARGQQISTSKPSSFNFGIWWDGDLSRELLDRTMIDKWNPLTNTTNRLFTIYQAAPIAQNNDTKATPGLSADLFGDWREEMIFRYSDNSALVIFTTTIPTNHRIRTLMHDPQYRTAIAWQNSGYNQPPHPSFYLGNNMEEPPMPNIFIANDAGLPVKLLTFTAKPHDKQVLVEWTATNEVNSKEYVVERSSNGRDFTAIETVADKGSNGSVNYYYIFDTQPLDGINYYRLKQVDIDGKYVYSNIKTVSFGKTKQLNIYPNPATSFVKLEMPPSNNVLSVTITNVEGRIVFRSRGLLSQVNSEINALLPLMKPGYYHVQVAEKEAIFKGPLIKQ
ncbi:T9SS type A sorting domain-containing protein [Aridibaculum aurantiacum]|uniref:rhamnogalacturonan lyase family protein n=1 Tax=Aridibaculum aurantiacum TaxID=2810307 RepID=UPI001A96B2D3|nr:T9SS type A sorting domain-containing protein [Aridibaculum aurantiacum]